MAYLDLTLDELTQNAELIIAALLSDYKALSNT